MSVKALSQREGKKWGGEKKRERGKKILVSSESRVINIHGSVFVQARDFSPKRTFGCA